MIAVVFVDSNSRSQQSPIFSMACFKCLQILQQQRSPSWVRSTFSSAGRSGAGITLCSALACARFASYWCSCASSRVWLPLLRSNLWWFSWAARHGDISFKTENGYRSTDFVRRVTDTDSSRRRGESCRNLWSRSPSTCTWSFRIGGLLVKFDHMQSCPRRRDSVVLVVLASAGDDSMPLALSLLEHFGGILSLSDKVEDSWEQNLSIWGFL